MATLEYFYDYVSPYSYLASTRVEELARRTGATLRYRPFPSIRRPVTLIY